MTETFHSICKGLIAAIVMTVANTAMAQDVAPTIVTAKADSTTLIMGDRTVVNVEIVKNSHEGVLLDMPERKKDYHGLEMIDYATDSTDLGNNRIELNYRFTFQAFDPSDLLTLPGFRYASNGDTVSSDILTFKVLPVELSPELGDINNPDSLKIHPDEKVLSIKSKWYDVIPDWWYWVVIGLVVAAVIAILVVLYYRNGKNIKNIFVPQKPLTPYQLAMQKLQELKTKHLIENGMAKQFYTEVTDIWRTYLQGRFGINAMEMTSRQILKQLRNNQETHLTANQMEQLLEISDFVKFAAMSPTKDEMERAYNIIRHFVESTQPVEELEQENKEDNK